MNKIPKILNDVKEKIEERNLETDKELETDQTESYYQLTMGMTSLEGANLSPGLSSFILSMSKNMMDFYNRFPKGSTSPERKVNLPKRDSKSRPT